MIFRIKETDRILSPDEASGAARRILAELLAEHYGIDRLPPIVREESGKPVFAGNVGLHFSLSHCKRAVMAAVDRRPVGCDVEDMAEDCPEELLEVAFSPEERNQIIVADSSEIELTRLWTRKEAAVKRWGRIPDDPRDWPSDDRDTLTVVESAQGYAYSIAVTGV